MSEIERPHHITVAFSDEEMEKLNEMKATLGFLDLENVIRRKLFFASAGNSVFSDESGPWHMGD